MTTASNGGFRRRLHGFWAWATHASIWLGALLVLPDAIIHLIHPLSPANWSWWQITLSVLLFIVYVAVYIHESGSMCERCFHDTPADAPVQATAKGWSRDMLHYYHQNFKIMLVMMVGIPALILATNVFAIDVLWDVQIIFMIAAWRYHRLLRPWCPWCRRWDGGGTPELIPNPDPSMTKQN